MDCKQKTGELCQRQLVIHPKCMVFPLYYGLVPRCSCLNRACLPFLPYPSAFEMWALDCFLPRNVNRKASRLGVWRDRYVFSGPSLCCYFLEGDNTETLGDGRAAKWKERGFLIHHGAHSSLWTECLCEWEINFYRVKPLKCWTLWQ